MKPAIALFGVVLAYCLSGCVTAGRDFVRPTANSLALGRTTQGEILQRYGQPFSMSQHMKNGQMIDSIHYFYGAKKPASTTMYKKHAWFYFVRQLMVGYAFSSAFTEDQHDFDASSVTDIVKGRTTKADVLARFGEPSGWYQFPATPENKSTPGDTALEYEFFWAPNPAGFILKHLYVLFDPAGVTKDVQFEGDQKAAPGSVPSSGE